jgi:hypothetical protein
LDGDNDPDVIVSELFFGEDDGEPSWDEMAHNLYVFENLGGTPPTWSKHNIAPNSYPSHLLQVVDINGDCAPDIVAEGAGTSVVSYHVNRGVPITVSPTGPGPDWQPDAVPEDCEVPNCHHAIPVVPACGLGAMIILILSAAVILVWQAQASSARFRR